MHNAEGLADRPSDSPPVIRRIELPHGSKARTPWPWLREQLDYRFGQSPRPAPDLDPVGSAAGRGKPYPSAKEVLGWGTPRYIRHVSQRQGRTIEARPFAGSPWADSVGVKLELLERGERMRALLEGKQVHHFVGTEEEFAEIRRRPEVKDVVKLRRTDYDSFNFFYTMPIDGLPERSLRWKILHALLEVPAKWPHEPDLDPDAEHDSEKVSVDLDPERVEAAKAHMKRRGHAVTEKSRLAYEVSCRDGATDEAWDQDWESYKLILRTRDADRAPPEFAVA